MTSCDCKTSPCCSEGPAARLWEPPGRQSVGRSDRKEENGIEKGHWTKKTGQNHNEAKLWSWTILKLNVDWDDGAFLLQNLLFFDFFIFIPLISLAISVTRCEPSGLVTTPRCSRFSCLCSNASVTLRRNCRSCCRCALQSWQWLSPTCSIQFFFLHSNFIWYIWYIWFHSFRVIGVFWARFTPQLWGSDFAFARRWKEWNKHDRTKYTDHTEPKRCPDTMRQTKNVGRWKWAALDIVDGRIVSVECLKDA